MAYNYEYPYVDAGRYNDDWMINKMKELVTEFNNLDQKFDSLSAQFTALKNYVDGYFKNLDLSAEIQNIFNQMIADGSLSTIIDKSLFTIFNNRKVVILGDSYSDNSTYPPNWTTYFTSVVEGAGGTVVNQAVNGNSFGAQALSDRLNAIERADIYVVFLGLNDYQAQWDFTVGTYPLLPSMTAVFTKLYSLNAQADIFYISPLKFFFIESANHKSSLVGYRYVLETMAASYGATIIGGGNAPRLCQNTKDVFIGDGVHPNTAYAPILADYILNVMRSRVSVGTSNQQNAVTLQAYGSSGYATLLTDSSGHMTLSFGVNDLSGSGWQDVCEAPKITQLAYGTIQLPASSGSFLARFDSGKFQIFTSGPVSQITGQVTLALHVLSSPFQ